MYLFGPLDNRNEVEVDAMSYSAATSACRRSAKWNHALELRGVAPPLNMYCRIAYNRCTALASPTKVVWGGDIE